MSYNIYCFDGRLNYAYSIMGVYKDTLPLVINKRTTAYADSAFTGLTATLYLANLNSDVKIAEINGEIATNKATFNVDTSVLPQAGNYRYIVKIVGTGVNYTLCVGVLKLLLNVES